MFNHHNPLINENNYNYFVRCVSRFKNLLQFEEHKLFIMILVNMDNISETVKSELIDFNNKFKKYTTNYTLLVILNITNKQDNYHDFTHHDNIDFLEVHTTSMSNGINFNSLNDNYYLKKIVFDTYNFDIK